MAEVLGQVVTGVAAKYTELVVELVANVKRLGQTLKKLHKGSASSGDGSMSDDEKIYLQVVFRIRHELLASPTQKQYDSSAHELAAWYHQRRAPCAASEERATACCSSVSRVVLIRVFATRPWQVYLDVEAVAAHLKELVGQELCAERAETAVESNSALRDLRDKVKPSAICPRASGA